MKNVVRLLCLALATTLLVIGFGASAHAKETPKVVTEAAKTLKCKQGEAYEADKPVKFAFECFVKGKSLGVADDGRTDLLLFKTKAAGKAFWSERLAGCGECFIVNKGKLWIAGGGGYEKDIAEYVKKKLGGKVYAF